MSTLLISDALHPEFLVAEHGPAEWTLNTIARLGDLNDAYTALLEAKQDIMEDTTLTKDARLVRIAQLYERNVAPKVVAVHAVFDDLEANRNGLAGALYAVVAPSAKFEKIALESEIRSALRSMPELDRALAIQQAVESGNRDVVAALNGPQFLHGVEADSVANYQADYIARHHVELNNAAEAVRSLKVRSDRTKSALRSVYDSVFTAAEKKKLRQAMAVSERANRHLN